MTRHPIVSEDLQRIAGSPLPFADLGGATVLVTGAAGFLPAYLVETFLFLNETRSLNIRVVGVVRNAEKARTRFAAYEGRKDLSLLVQDAAQPIAVDGPVDFIVHAASQASPKYYGKDPVGTLAPNVMGTFHLLELARQRGSRGVLFFSSGEVYGVVPPERIPIPETETGSVDSMSVRSCYAEAKRVGETMCVSWHAQYGVPARVVRPFHTYGPGMALDDGRVFSDFVADLVHGRDIVMHSDGSAVRPYCYLADATVGFLTVLLKGQDAQAYNVGNPDMEVSVLELAERLVRLFPEKGLRVIRQAKAPDAYLPSPIPRNCPEISKLRRLGWNPLTSIEDGFSRTVRSFL